MNPGHALRYAGRTLWSSIHLPSLRVSPDPHASGSITVLPPVIVSRLRPCLQWAHEWRETDGSVSLRLARMADGTAMLRTMDQCDFFLDPMRATVGIEHESTLDPETREHLLIDQALPRLLAEQGELVVHAACIGIGDTGVLFLGRSGWGKSTLASLLHGRGHQLVSDDCGILSVDQGVVSATPTYPSLRLYHDSAHHRYGEDLPDAISVAHYSRKQRLRVDEAHHDAPIAIAAIYLLNNPADANGTLAIAALPPAVACIALIEHGFRLNLASREHSTRQLRQAADIVRAVPAWSLSYPRDFSQAHRVIDTLLNHVAISAGKPLPFG